MRQRGGHAVNDLQIQYFLKAAQRLNFSEAARELFISQPALSQQITAIEKELNMQLFIRDKNRLRLTPAAAVLLQELPACVSGFQQVIERARVVSEGHSGSLRIGVLEGHILPDNFRAAYHAFCRAYPNISISFALGSFSRLRRELDEKQLDVALTLDLDIQDALSYLWIRTDQARCAFFAAENYTLHTDQVRGWADLRGETLIFSSDEDSAAFRSIVAQDCRRAGFVPKLLLASSVGEQMLYIDAGLGVGVSNAGSYISTNPHVRCLWKTQMGQEHFVLAWHRENVNSAIALFTNFTAEYIRTRGLTE